MLNERTKRVKQETSPPPAVQAFESFRKRRKRLPSSVDFYDLLYGMNVLAGIATVRDAGLGAISPATTNDRCGCLFFVLCCKFICFTAHRTSLVSLQCARVVGGSVCLFLGNTCHYSDGDNHDDDKHATAGTKPVCWVVIRHSLSLHLAAHIARTCRNKRCLLFIYAFVFRTKCRNFILNGAFLDTICFGLNLSREGYSG